ncbi:MAG: hypothetical protein JWM87_2112 [Candidatus Eremiobacteraeota bacterium]|nr:hypothetical protein [Candidatus Eremiobacteraeota bacterium]
MILARVFTATAGCVVLGAAVAACSGSFGSGSGMPNTLSSPSFGGPSAAPTPPTSSSVILTYGENAGFQTLPEVGGYGGAVAFPKAPEPTAAPASKSKAKNGSPEPAAAPTAVAVSIGATLSIVKPQDGPDLNFVSGKGKRKRSREQPARALAYVTLLPTHDATLESYPRIQLDIPREIASQYRDGEFGLALWNSGEKDAKYRLAVAELDTIATPPPMRVTTAAPVPAASPGASAKPGSSAAPTQSPATLVSTPRPGTSGSPLPGGSPGINGPAVPAASPTLPPARLLFSGTAATLKLVANRPAVFALYALPHPSMTPVPKASGSPGSASAGSPRPAASGSPHPSASGSPAAAAGASAAPLPGPTKSP